MAKKSMAKPLEELEQCFLQPAELTPNVLVQTFGNAYIDARQDAKGEISLTVDGVLINMRKLESEQALLLYAFWPLNPHVPSKDALKLCNDINDHMALVRCSVIDAQEQQPPYLWVDYLLLCKGGVTNREIVAATRSFAAAIADGLSRFGTSGMFAQD